LACKRVQFNSIVYSYHLKQKTIDASKTLMCQYCDFQCTRCSDFVS